MTKKGVPHSVRPRAEARAAELIATRRWSGVMKIPLPPDVTPLERLLIATHTDLSSREQAKLLNVDRGIVEYWRRALYARGLLVRELRAWNAPVTPREIEAIARLWRDGWGISAIARARGVNVIRIRRALQRAGVTPETPRRQWLNAQAVSRLLNISPRTVCKWVARGWLPDLRPHAATGVDHVFAMDDLVALARNRATWYAWEPAQLDDPTLRRLAEAERRCAGGAWRSMGEIAEALNLPAATLSTWRTAYGLFTGLDVRSHAGARFVWLTDQQQAHLASLALRGRAVGNTPHRNAATALKHCLIAAYGRPETYQAAAD